MSLLTNLSAYYKLDGNVNDELGSHNGSNSGGSFSAANGKIVQGIGFNGSTYGDLNYKPDFGTDSFSIFLWFKTSVSQNEGYFLGMYDNTTSQNYVVLGLGQATPADSQNKAGFFIRGSTYGGELQKNVSPSAVNDNNWHHFGLVVDKSANKFKGYFDGAKKTEDNYNLIGNVTNTNITIGLGCLHSSVNGYVLKFNGAVDEIGIWKNRGLTDSDVAKLYKNGMGFPYPFENGVKTNWFM